MAHSIFYYINCICGTFYSFLINFDSIVWRFVCPAFTSALGGWIAGALSNTGSMSFTSGLIQGFIENLLYFVVFSPAGNWVKSRTIAKSYGQNVEDGFNEYTSYALYSIGTFVHFWGTIWLMSMYLQDIIAPLWNTYFIGWIPLIGNWFIVSPTAYWWFWGTLINVLPHFLQTFLKATNDASDEVEKQKEEKLQKKRLF